MAKKKKKIRIKAFELVTPKIGKDTYYRNIFDYEMIDILFQSMLGINKMDRKYIDSNNSFNLGGYGQSHDADITEGYFLTARYGLEQDQIDIKTQQNVGKVPETNGLEAEVHFMIDRKTGLLLVQEDHNKVFNKKILGQFMRLHKSLIYPYVAKFNEINSQSNLVIHKNSMFQVVSLPPKDFFEQLAEMDRITHATVKLDENTDKGSKDVSRILDDELNENGIEEYALELKIQNKSGRAMVSTFKKYFERIRELQLYDSFSVQGRLRKNGREVTINQNSITRDFEVEVSCNSKGVISMQDVHNEMTNIIKNENPISAQKNNINWVMVGDNKDVKEAIQSKIAEYNERESEETEQTG